jgi:putative oxygen-independent coproporphyrinogen III oxidase
LLAGIVEENPVKAKRQYPGSDFLSTRLTNNLLATILPAMQKFTDTIPLSLYIHLPWCVRKCPYCDFNSHAARDTLPEELYVAALLRDFEEQLPRIWGRRFCSIFFGGGTPSLFSEKSIAAILTGINTRLPFHADLEITLEANPGTLDEARFKGFRKEGVNRLSLGIQSLQDDKLKALGRIHGREQALRAIECATNAGFANFNLDFMHGLPQQSVADAIGDLEDGLAYKPPHVSWYQLTLEPNTLFHHQPPTLPPEEILYDIQEQGKQVLAANGLTQYEVSAYCQPEKACAHNLNYWEFGDYLGIGAGSHSKITCMEQKKITRHWQVKHPNDYLDPQKKFTAEQKILTPAETSFEFMLNALRLQQGVPLTLFLKRSGLSQDFLQPALTRAREKKLLSDNSDWLCATPLGQRFLDDLVALFL